ncbi:MAG: 30S ribosomal protein S19 [Candidatus Poseidoniales archaeon]|jgi:small subunit ribosomal protein S19
MAKRKRRYMTPKAARRRVRKLRGKVSERRKKEFLYRGYTVEQLQALPLYPTEDDVDVISVVGLLSARARRSFSRGISGENEHFRLRVKHADGKVIRTHRRDMVILPEFVGQTIAVHNGRGFSEIEIRPEMIGHYLGEFGLTRRNVAHSGPGVGATKSSKHVALK